jgi:DNA-binding NtrC family response regulator
VLAKLSSRFAWTDKLAGEASSFGFLKRFLIDCMSVVYVSVAPCGIHSASPGGVNEDGKQTTILLVDDDVEVLKALKKVLQKGGYEVIAHSDAPSAMRFINETKTRFDLVITDISMPGMSGTAFLDALKTAFPKVPVIVITAFGDWGQYMETIRNGAYEYLSKPLDKAELLAVVQRALTNGRQNAHVS